MRSQCHFVLLLALFSGLAVGDAWADSQALYWQSLTNFETYAESVWHTASYGGAPADAGYWGDGQSAGNGGIRGNGGIALVYAVLCVAQPTHPNYPARLARVRQALNYNAATHVTGSNYCVNGAPWGWSSSSSTDWQTPLWTGEMGLACLILQSNLPAATVSNVQRVLASEATHRAGIAPASGYLGDTKAEENGWDCYVLTLAPAWMPNHPGASNWIYAAKRYLANTYSVANTNGDPLASWLSTVTAYPDFSIENHGFYHPGYQMVAGECLGDAWLMARLANPNLAAQLVPFAEHNVLVVWTNLAGTIMDSGEMAFPAGEDWALHDFGQNSYLAWLAAHFNQPLARWADTRLAQLQLYRQLANGDGRIVGPSGGGFYREAVCGFRTAMAWLQWANAENPAGPSQAPPFGVSHLSTVGLLEQRGSNGFVSFHYGRPGGASGRVAAIIEAPAASIPADAFMATPRIPGLLGFGALGPPTAARLVSLVTNANAFTAELQITNGANGTTEVYVNCTGESLGLVEVPWPTVGVANPVAASFVTGIENAPFTGGARLVEWSGGSAIITNRSGAALTVTNPWICIANRYGLAAGPAGYFSYKAPTSYTRVTPSLNEAGTAEDTLSYYCTNSLIPRYAVYFPGRTTLQTSNLASQISWSVSGTNATLIFPGAGGVPAQVNALVSNVLLRPFPPYLLPIGGITASSEQPGYPATNAVNSRWNDFWVSALSPTNSPQWLKVSFPRQVSLAEFQIGPRTDNGGYGPSTIQMLINVSDAISPAGLPAGGTIIFEGTMSPTSTLDALLPRPVYASNALLVITGSYDRGLTNAPRNTQVAEMAFLERALPGTFADWALSTFTDSQLSVPAIGGAAADPDQDGVANLLEFTTGGDPFTNDAAGAKLVVGGVSNGRFTLEYRERKILGDVTGGFESSTNLVAWSPMLPLTVTNFSDLGTVWLKRASFPIQEAQACFRLRYSLGP